MLEILAETGSTNAEIAARIASENPPPEGLWLIADRQTAGKGRLNRDWLDGEGNFMGSTAVHLAHGDPQPASLSLVAGLAVFEVIQSFVSDDRAIHLKWPNDLMAGNAKLAGILLERTGDTVVVGIGVNLVAAPAVSGRATAALGDFAAAPSRDAFAARLDGQFAVELERWRTFGVESIIRRWVAAAHPMGTLLHVTEPDGTHSEGAFAGLDQTGALQLRLADGAMRAIHAGDVFPVTDNT